VIAATNQDLAARIREGVFRKDLFYRLKTHQVKLPPLRERKDDIPVLLEHFLKQAAEELRKKAPKVPKELLTLLQTYHFPGNVRELKAMVFDAVTRSRTSTLPLGTFVEAMGRDAAASEGEKRPANLFSRLDVLPKPDEVMDQLIDEALDRAKGNQSMAARLLGLSQSALNRRIRRC
jgi:DNA-binding NtrC family response regulator